MIITTSKHGRTKRDGRRLAKHLAKTENELALLVEVGNSLAETLPELIEICKIYQSPTSSKASLHHLSINPATELSRERLLDAVHRVRLELDPTGKRPFGIVVHIKKRAELGGSAEHAHLILSHVDETSKALDDSFTKIRTERVARETEYDFQKKFGIPESAVLGRHFRSTVKALWQTRPEVAVWLEQTFGPNPPKPNSAISSRARGRARAQGFNLPKAKAAVRAAWIAADNVTEFRANLENAGLNLRPGDKRAVWIVVDRRGRLVGAVNRLLKMRQSEFEQQMGVSLAPESRSKPITHDLGARALNPRAGQSSLGQDRPAPGASGTRRKGWPSERPGRTDRGSSAADRRKPIPARSSPLRHSAKIGLDLRNYRRMLALADLRRLDFHVLLALVQLAKIIPSEHFDHDEGLHAPQVSDPLRTDLWGVALLPKPR
jgi:hypothetical protein